MEWNDGGRWGLQLIGKNLLNRGFFITVASNGTAPSGPAGPPPTVVLQLTCN